MHAFTTSMYDFSLFFIGGTYCQLLWRKLQIKLRAWQFYVSGKRWLLTDGNLGFSIAVLAHWKKDCKNVAAFIITTNKQTEYTARKSDTSFLILQRYFAILLWMLPSNSIYNFNFRSWMTLEGPTRKNLTKKLTNGRMPSCQKNRVSGNKNRVIRPTT